eukprot:364282-Chlamydomonas_euryale.AAC.60
MTIPAEAAPPQLDTTQGAWPGCASVRRGLIVLDLQMQRCLRHMPQKAPGLVPQQTGLAMQLDSHCCRGTADACGWSTSDLVRQ